MEQACRVLEVSRSGYYGWKAEKICRRRLQNQAIRRRLIELHEKYPALGLDSLYRLLKPEFGCSRKRVHRQMRLAGISSVRRRAYKMTTHSNHSHPIAPNLLQRNFSFDRPDQAWVGDITYIPTGEGWLYLAIVKDLCTRKIVGYAFSDKIDTRLTLAALDMAYRRRKPARGLIFHSDRGVQYAARAYRERLETYGIRQSMSRRGDPYDNAVAENFFSCLRTPNKTEKRSKRQQGRKKPNGYQLCVHIGRAGACIDGTRQRFAQQPSGAFQDERNCPPHVWQCGALYVSRCTPVCKTENRTLYQREVSEDDKWVSRANVAGTADDPAYIPAFYNHSHWRQ